MFWVLGLLTRCPILKAPIKAPPTKHCLCLVCEPQPPSGNWTGLRQGQVSQVKLGSVPVCWLLAGGGGQDGAAPITKHKCIHTLEWWFRFQKNKLLHKELSSTFNFILISVCPGSFLLGYLVGGRDWNRIPMNGNYHNTWECLPGAFLRGHLAKPSKHLIPAKCFWLVQNLNMGILLYLQIKEFSPSNCPLHTTDSMPRLSIVSESIAQFLV